MSGPTALHTPFARGPAKPVTGPDGRQLYRKRVLPVGAIDYKGRKLMFSKDFNDQLAASYSVSAYDQVPFQLAPDDNRHTNDVERFGGEVVSMESEPDGLYITLAPTTRGEAVLRDNPRLGISARIVEDYQRSDGKFYPAAVQHVLGTLDPRIPGLGAWETVEMSNDIEKVYDLTGATFAAEEEGRGNMPDFTEEQKARLAKLLDAPEAEFNALLATMTPPAASASPAGNGPAGGEDELTDEEIDELVAAAEELEREGALEPALAGAGATLSADPQTQMAIELAHARADESEARWREVQKRLDTESYQTERANIVQLSGIPPYIVDLARPLLEGAGHSVELSNGTAVDAGLIIRKVFEAMGKTARMLDLSIELGSADESVTEAELSQRGDLLSRAKSQMGF